MEIWYEALDIETLIAEESNLKARKEEQQFADQARKHIAEHLFPKIAEAKEGGYRLVDQPPILFHERKGDFEGRAHAALAAYRQSLSDERKTLLDRYRLQDFALKVVGIGSVGTRCYVGLFISDEGHPLLLQFKEADRSVLEPYTIRSKYQNQGERVVMGQRLMQSSSDIFLGWARSKHRRDFYVRQLRDMKLSIPIAGMDSSDLARYTKRCGWLLARAHAKSGDAAGISGYLGKGDSFDRALGKFASAYADQTEHDHAVLVKAVRSGRIEAVRDE